MFWIKSLGGTFKALQKKLFGPKIFELHAGVKKVPIWQFFSMGSDGRALLVQPSKMHHLFVLGADEYLEKLESAYYFMLKYSKQQCVLLSWVLSE